MTFKVTKNDITNARRVMVRVEFTRTVTAWVQVTKRAMYDAIAFAGVTEMYGELDKRRDLWISKE
jgi:hypothetical protein